MLSPTSLPFYRTQKQSLPTPPPSLQLVRAIAMAMQLLLPGLVSIALVFLLYRLLFKRYRLPPGPPALPIVGNLYDISPVRFRCFWEWSKKYGPIMSVWTGPSLNVVVSSSDLAKEILKEKDQQLAARNRSRAANLFSRNGEDLIWADYGPHYVKVRKVCTLELFTLKRLDALRPVREEEVSAMIQAIFRDFQGRNECEGKTIMLRSYLAAVAFNNITRIAFGKRFIDEEGNIDSQGLQFKEIIAEGMRLGSSLKMSEHIPYIRWMFPFHKEEFTRHGACRDSLTKAIMQEHTLTREKSGAKQHFVDALLTLQERYQLSETNIIGLLWDMITAGMDTTAITVEWAMAELIRNPRVQQKVQEELDRVVGTDRIINENDLLTTPYLQCVVKESLRLHPPTPLMLPHKATEHVTVGGYDIPKGTVVHVNVWAIARDPSIWKDPLTFRPERFLEEDVDIKGHDYRLLPFGAGRRVCPGAQLGLNLVQLMLARLLHHFSWGPAEGMKVENISMDERPGVVTYMAKPLEASVWPRLPAHLCSD